MESNFLEIMQTIKALLKSKKITYKELAAQLQMSESGLKKVLNGSDASIGKIQSICQILDVTLLDILQENQSRKLKDDFFTSEQEAFFYLNLNFFYFYWLLAIERRELDEIKNAFNLSEQQVFTYLSRLDTFGLIELHPENKIKLFPKVPKKWIGKGPLTKKIQTNWGIDLWQEVQDNKETSDNLSTIRFLKLSTKSLQDLNKALADIEEEFVARSVREEKFQNEELRPIKLMCALAEGSFIRELEAEKS